MRCASGSDVGDLSRSNQTQKPLSTAKAMQRATLNPKLEVRFLHGSLRKPRQHLGFRVSEGRTKCKDVPDASRDRRTICPWRASPGPRQATSSGWSEHAVPPGPRSTGCPTVVRCKRSSVRPGRTGVGRRRATSRNGSPRRGCARYSTMRAAGPCRAWCARGQLRRRRRGVSALHRARPWSQALHGSGIPLDDQRASAL